MKDSTKEILLRKSLALSISVVIGFMIYIFFSMSLISLLYWVLGALGYTVITGLWELYNNL